MSTSLRLVAVAAILGTITTARAETWNATTGGSWLDPTKWTPPVIPMGQRHSQSSMRRARRLSRLDAPITLGEYQYNINAANTTTINNGTFTEGGDYNDDGIVDAGDYVVFPRAVRF